MSDSNKPKPLPPDDFGATTPNIKIPKSDSPGFSEQPASDWEKTNYNYSPKDLGGEEWNKTAYNIPKSTPPPKDAEWGMTGAQINLPNNQSNQSQQSFDDDDFGGRRADYDKTSVGINLPKNEPPPQYQEPPSQKQEEEKAEERKRGGIPGWLWASAGLLGMFLFAVVTLLAVYFIFLGKTGFEVVIPNVPTGSILFVDGSPWGVTASDGSVHLQTLKAGETKKISIQNPAWTCPEIPITLEEAKDGNIGKDAITKNHGCSKTGGPQPNPNPNPPSSQCIPRKDDKGESARNCARAELDKLEKAGTWTVEQLLYAMNLYVINFDKNSATIKPVDMQFIERAAGFMKKLPPNTVIEVGGHTDSDAPDDYNMKLSDRRATAVRNALVSKGISSTMLRTKPYGETQPLYDNGTEDGKFGNRRIEYKQVG